MRVYIIYRESGQYEEYWIDVSSVWTSKALAEQELIRLNYERQTILKSKPPISKRECRSAFAKHDYALARQFHDWEDAVKLARNSTYYMESIPIDISAPEKE